MRKSPLLVALLAILTFALTSCGCNQPYAVQQPMVQQQPYDYIQGPGGQQMVACYDNSGSRFLLDYMLFSSLMNSGGYGGVTNYYHSYPGRVTVWNNSYSSWRPFTGRSYTSGSWRGYSRPTSTYRSTTTSPSTYRSTTAPARPSNSSSGWGRSSTPSTYRSSSTPSYRPSSPSRPSSSWRSSSSSSRRR